MYFKDSASHTLFDLALTQCYCVCILLVSVGGDLLIYSVLCLGGYVIFSMSVCMCKLIHAAACTFLLDSSAWKHEIRGVKECSVMNVRPHLLCNSNRRQFSLPEKNRLTLWDLNRLPDGLYYHSAKEGPEGNQLFESQCLSW